MRRELKPEAKEKKRTCGAGEIDGPRRGENSVPERLLRKACLFPF